MDALLKDLRFGLRMLAKHKGFSLIAVLALTLGIGVNSAIFSVVNAVILKPLPFPQAERIVAIWEDNPQIKIGLDYFPVSASKFVDWRDRSSAFESITALEANSLNFTGAGEPEQLNGASVSAGFFDVMHVKPALGRPFLPAEDRANGDPVIVISHGLWQRRFGGDPGIVGRSLTLDGKSRTVIGVMPAGFQFPSANDMPAFMYFAPEIDYWSPIALSEDRINRRGNHNLAVIARLKPGITIEQASADMKAQARNDEQRFREYQGFSVRLLSLSDQIVGKVRGALIVLLAAVGFVLLIACANVANLLLARATSRQREMAIRTALGASRRRLVQQLLTESMLLALLGGGAGLILNSWSIDLLVAAAPSSIPRLGEVTTDLRVVTFVFATSVLTGLLFGLVPALQAAKLNINESLRESGRALSGGLQSGRMRSLLVVAEVSLSLVLLIGAGLLIRSFVMLLEVDPGFNAENVLTLDIFMPEARYRELRDQSNFVRQVVDQVKSLPGVESAGAVSHLPLSGAENSSSFTIEDRPPVAGTNRPLADNHTISPEYFATMGIPLIKGRYFTQQDNERSTPVVIINESMVRNFFGNDEAIGKRLRIGGDNSPWLEIVGVVKDVKHSGLDVETKAQVYSPYQQRPERFFTLTVRSSAPPQTIIGAVRKAVFTLDKDQPITDIKPLARYLDEARAPRRFNMALLAAFAAIALVLAVVGIYGVISYSVTQRTQEIGIRMALGAQTGDVLAMVLRQGLTLTLVGVAIGLVAAFALTRVMESLLYGVSARDPLTFASVAIVLTLAALVACFIPARRATRIDPMVALRYD